jgi:hypothetical protein
LFKNRSAAAYQRGKRGRCSIDLLGHLVVAEFQIAIDGAHQLIRGWLPVYGGKLCSVPTTLALQLAVEFL